MSASLEEEQEREKGEKLLSYLSSVIEILVTVLEVCNQETYLEIYRFGFDGGVSL